MIIRDKVQTLLEGWVNFKKKSVQFVNSFISFISPSNRQFSLVSSYTTTNWKSLSMSFPDGAKE